MRAFTWRREGVPCPKHLLLCMITQSGLQHVCVEPDCDYSVRLQGPYKEDGTVTKEDKEKRKTEIENFVKNKKASGSSSSGEVTPAKKPTTKIPADLNATSGKSKKQLRRENEAKRDDADTTTEGEVKKKLDKETDANVKPKKAAKDPSMISVSQIATDLGLDPKRARAKLRALVEKDELPDGLEVTEGRWPLVKRDSKQHKQLIAALKPAEAKAVNKTKKDDEDEPEGDDESDDDEDEE